MRLLLLSICLLVTTSLFAQDDIQQYESAMSKKDYQSALSAITKVLKDKNQQNANNYYKRAVVYAAMGNPVFAVADCTSALAYDNNMSKAYFLRGKCKDEVKDPTYITDMQNGGQEGIAYLRQKKVKITNQDNKTYVNVKSDVDINIPSISIGSNTKTFVLIISNENYLENNISSVNYAKKDGEIFKQYCISTLGIPEENIHYRQDATRNQMRIEVKWVQSIAEAFGRQANVIVYYSGHGMPDEESRKAYLLPSDGIANDPESAYSLSLLYSQLGSMDVKSVIVFMDACFSGSQRNGGMLTASKGVVIKPKNEILQGNLIVLAASQGDETAYPYDEKGHGLFTYFLLKKLQDSNGNTTLYELGNYIIDNVRQTAIIKNRKKQTPSINVSSAVSDLWKNLKLK